MDPFLVISPHLDDAVLSVGQFLACWPGATVLSIFTGQPAEPTTTTFDENCGFADSTLAMRARWHEDDRALRVLRARAIRAGFLDQQYHGGDSLLGPISEVIRRVVGSVGTLRVLGPLGLAHPDHLTVSAAYLHLVRGLREAGIECWAYEELPARVLWPEDVPPALGRLEVKDLTATLEFIGIGPIEEKERAIACYRSQLWALDDRVLYVPERIYRLEPAA